MVAAKDALEPGIDGQKANASSIAAQGIARQVQVERI
jgi:hypothetical protein